MDPITIKKDNQLPNISVSNGTLPSISVAQPQNLPSIKVSTAQNTPSIQQPNINQPALQPSLTDQQPSQQPKLSVNTQGLSNQMPEPGDINGLYNSLQNIKNYNSDQQVKLIQQGAHTGLLDPQKSADIIRQMYQPITDAANNPKQFYKNATVGNAIKQTGAGLVNSTGLPFLIKTDIVNPTKQTAAIVTGNKKALANVNQDENATETPRAVLGNSAEALTTILLPGATKIIEPGLERAGLVAGAKAGLPDVASNFISKIGANTITGSLAGGAFNVEGAFANNQPILPALKGGAEFGAAAGMPFGIINLLRGGEVPNESAQNIVQEAQNGSKQAVPTPQPVSEPPSIRPFVNPDEEFYGQINPDAAREVQNVLKTSGDYQTAVDTYSQLTGENTMSAMSKVNLIAEQSGIIPTEIPEGEYLKIPEGAPQETAQAAQKLADLYHTPLDEGNNMLDVLNNARGRSNQFKAAADDFMEAMQKELTPGERTAVIDNLEGVADPEQLTSRVQAVTELSRQLNDYGYNVLDAMKKNGMSRVRSYATRVFNRTGRGTATQGRARVVFNNLSDLFSGSTSGFAERRAIHKYVADDGEVRYGTMKDNDLHKIKDEQTGKLRTDVFRDGQGKEFRPQFTSQRELKANGFSLQEDYAKVAKQYHTSVGKVRSKMLAVQQITRNPQKFGVVTADEAEGMRGFSKISATDSDLDGMWAPSKTAKLLNSEYQIKGDTGNLGARVLGSVYRRTMNFIYKDIVFNPLIHGLNTAVNAFASVARDQGIIRGFANGAMFTGRSIGALLVPGYRATLVQRYLDSGYGHFADYGMNRDTIGSRLFNNKNVNKITNLSGYAMEGLENTWRVAAFDTLTKGKRMTDANAGRTIDTYLGDGRAVNSVARDTIMFYKWLQTNKNVILDMLGHPIANRGVYSNFAAIAAATWALDKGFRDWTGNQHAHLHIPGMLGIAHDAATIIDDTLHHQYREAGVVGLSRLNPLGQAGLNQTYGKDLYTGQDISGSAGNRAQDVFKTLVAQGTDVTKMQQGKSSLGETGLNLGGIYTPHTKGAPAIPNQSNPLASIVNTPGAKIAKPQGNINDPTGLTQATNYYNQLNKATSSFGPNDPVGASTFQKFVSRDHTSNGDSLLLGVNEDMAHWQDFVGADAHTQQVIQSFYRGEANHNPIWDLPLNQLQIYAEYKSEVPGDPNTKVIEQNNPWLLGEFAKEQTWYTQNQSNFANNFAYPADYVAYPNITPQQSQMISDVTALSKITNRTPDQETQLTNLENNTDLRAAFALLDKYTNDRRAMIPGVQPIPYPSQNLQPDQEQLLQTESTLPKGSKSAFIRANQDAWNSMEQVLAQNTLYDVEEYGGIIQQGGKEPNFLKDAYNLGQYDIAKGTNTQGGSVYTVNPALAYSGGTVNGVTYGGSSGSSGSSKSTKKPFVPRPRVKYTKPVKIKRPPRRVRVRAPRLASQRQTRVTTHRTVPQTAKIAKNVNLQNM